MTDIDTEREAIRAALAPGIAEIQACVYADEGSCGGCQKDLDVIAPLVESLIDARVQAAKAEALREAAEIIMLRTNHVGCESCRINAEGEAGSWLLARAECIEEER